MAEQTNPYLALLQQERPRGNWMDLLSNALLGVGSGISQASSSGQGWGAGIAPGLMLGNQMTAQAEHQAEQERLRKIQIGIQASEWDEKRAERLRKEKQLQLLAGQYGPSAGTDQGVTTPGITAPQPSPVKMGPDLVAAGTPLVNYLTAQHGFSPLAAATVAGNLYQESGFNPGVSGDGGTAFGLAQWRLERQDKLKAFAASQQKPVTDPQVQLDYLVTEMKGGDMGAQRAYAMLQQAKTPEQANAAMMHFFRPQGYTPANPTGGLAYGQRVANTRALLPQGGPSDATYAPVPTLPDPDEAPAGAPGPAPRPGLGPRATPAGPAPDGVPLAQGGGEGEVVLPRIGLPFPARPAVAAPPGSVPFPTLPTAPAPGGPVQPNYTPTPSTPSMVPADITPPPVPKLPDRPVLTQANSARLQSLVLGGHPEQAMSEYNRLLTMQRSEVMDRHKTEVEIWRQQQEGARHERGEKARLAAEERAQARQLDAEQRRTAAEQERHDRTIAEQQKVREDAARTAGDKQSFEQTKFMREDENKLRDDFNAAPPVKSYRIVVPMLESAKDAEKRPTRAADLNLVYAFAKLMDPDSVVRESETAGVVATASVADRLSAYVGQLNGQPMLNPDVRAKLIKELDSRFRALEESYRVHENAYAGIAERRGLHRDNIIMPIRGPKPPEAKPAADVPVYDTSGKRIQ